MDLIEIEPPVRCPCYGQMSRMNGVKRTTK
jgi:hypothetical protein